MKRTFLEIGYELFDILLESDKPLTLTELQETLSTNFNTIKKHLEYIEFSQSMPEVNITGGKARMEVFIEKPDISDKDFIRAMVGTEVPPHIELLIRILDKKAFIKKSGIPASEFSKEDLLLLKKQKEQGRIILNDKKVVLSSHGKLLAQGAKNYFSSL